MVFVWSHLTRDDAAYTLVQVAVNDLIMLVAFAPIAVLLLGISNIAVPWDTVVLSVVLYIVIPLAASYFTRRTFSHGAGCSPSPSEPVPAPPKNLVRHPL